MPHAQRRLKAHHVTERVTLQRVIRLLVHVAEERREAGRAQIHFAPHHRRAVGIGGNQMRRRSGRLGHAGGSAVITDFWKRKHGGGGMFRKEFFHARQKVRIERVAVVVQAHDDFTPCLPKHPVARKDGTA